MKGKPYVFSARFVKIEYARWYSISDSSRATRKEWKYYPCFVPLLFSMTFFPREDGNKMEKGKERGKIDPRYETSVLSSGQLDLVGASKMRGK